MRNTTMLGSLVAVVAVVGGGLGGCTVVSPDDGNPFASGNPVTSMTPATSTGDATESSASSGSGGAESSGGGDTTGGGSATTMVPMGSTTNTTLGGSSSGGDSSGGGGMGMQPGMGQYSECTIPEDCGVVPNLCITITGVGGFCTISGCAGVGNCDPSPVPTAVAACVPAEIDMMPDMICVLQCVGGTACPVPMVCTNVTGFGEICA